MSGTKREKGPKGPAVKATPSAPVAEGTAEGEKGGTTTVPPTADHKGGTEDHKGGTEGEKDISANVAPAGGTDTPTVTIHGVRVPWRGEGAGKVYASVAGLAGATMDERVTAYETAKREKGIRDETLFSAIIAGMRSLTRDQWEAIIKGEGGDPAKILPREGGDTTADPPTAARKVKIRPPRDGVFYGVTLMRGGDVVRVRAIPNGGRDGSVSSFTCVLVNAVGEDLTAEDHTGKRVPLTTRVESRSFIYPDTRDAAESLAGEISSAISFATQPCDPATLTTGETVRVWDYGGGTSTPFATPADWKWEGNYSHNGTSTPNVVSREGSFVQWESPAYLTRVPSGLSPFATYVYQTTRDAVEALARTMYGAGLDDATVRAAVSAIRGNIVSAYPDAIPVVAEGGSTA